MRTAADLIEELNAVDESVKIEAKAGSEVGKSMMETVCAFANEPGLGGGYLLLGVERTHNQLFDIGYEATGLRDPDKMQSDLASQCRSMLSKTIRPEIQVSKVGDESVVVAFIPESPPTDKPVYISSKGLPGGAFRRIGPTDQSCTEDDLLVLYEGHRAETYDTTVISDGTLADIDPDAIEEYRSLRAKVNPDAEELTWSDDDLLRAFGCVRDEGEHPRPTAAGVLLFGTPMALRRCFPMVRVDYIRVPGKEWVKDPDHRFDTVEIRSPLITAIRRATNAVLDDLPKSFSLPSGEIQSTDAPILPARVIREAVVNAVMHRSYRIQGAPAQIIRYSNRLEIRNPGHSLKAEEQLGEPGSETRNPKIAAVLHEVNIAETKGSGIRVMRELMQQSNLLPPTLDSSRQPDQFVATFLFHHFLGPADLEWLGNLTGESLSDEESRALVFVRETGAIDNAAYREINQTDTLNASTHLRRLRDLSLLEKKGSGNRTYYVPGETLGLRPESPAPAESEKSHLAGAQSHQPSGESHQPGNQSHLGEPNQISTRDLPPELAERLPKPGQRPSQDALRTLIVELCEWQPLTARNLAVLLNRRDHKPLIRDHLGPLIESGDLRYTIPAMKRHPQQAYTAAPEETKNQ
ncbi:MAG: ATP-binding protein [Planctomycetota bacterium]